MAFNGIAVNPFQKSKNPQRYTEMSTERSPFLTRGKEYARMTLPYILPETDNRGGAANQHGFQGIGAQAANHLSNKATLTLFPPQKSFFKADLSDESKAVLLKEGFSDVDLISQLVKIEEKTVKLQGKIGARVASTQAMKHLIIVGNVCLKLPVKGKGKMRAIPLSRYVCKRDVEGELIDLIILEEKTLESFSKKEQAAIRATTKGKNLKPTDKVKLYTRASMQPDGMFLIEQSADDIPVGETSRLKPERLPWIVLRWNHADGESYGRGLVEDHSGDFYVMEFLSEAMAKGMALMADIKYLVKPGGITDINHLISSPAGEYVAGNLDDIGVLQLEKYADFTPIANALKDYERRIGQAFLLSSANRRQAERVTATELRMDANELETSHGGIYSSLAETWQVPMAMLLLTMVNAGLGSGMITPSILTGLEALGRIGDLEKLNQFSEMMALPASWPQGVQARMKWGDFSRTVSAAISMDTPWLMTDKEFAAAQAAQVQAQQQQTMLEGASKGAPAIIKDQLQQGGQAAPAPDQGGDQ